MTAPLHSIDIVRNGVTVAVARAIEETSGRYQLLGHWLIPKGRPLPFEGQLVLPALVRKKPRRGPKGGPNMPRVIAAWMCKRYCHARGIPYSVHAPEMLDYTDRSSIDREIRKEKAIADGRLLSNGHLLYCQSAEGAPDGFLIYCPKGAALSCDSREIRCDGFFWMPGMRVAEWHGFVLSAEAIPDEWIRFIHSDKDQN